MNLTGERIRYFLIVGLFYFLHIITFFVLVAGLPFKNDKIRSTFPSIAKIMVIVPFWIIKAVNSLLNIIFFKMTKIYNYDLDTDKQYIFMGNHETYLDFVIVLPSWYKKFTTIVIDYVKYFPILGQSFMMVGFYFVNKNKSTNLVTNVSQILKDDEDLLLVFFPEGHRFFDRKLDMTRLRNGGFAIAKETGLPIVPVYHNLMDSFDDVKKEHHYSNNLLTIIGNPIDVKDKSVDELKNEYFNAMLNLKNQHEQKLKSI